ncbi:MAG: DMT family transporter [Chloroflexota bacterium]|nr:DMT family transporter [Chloroflexota bacterium]
MKRGQLAADAALLFVTAIWGATFVMVQDAVSGFPVFAFLTLRFSLATLALLPFFLRARRSSGFRLNAVGTVGFDRLRSLLPGILVGIALFVGYSFQTFGLRFTTPAKAGFITGLSVVMVPIGQALFFRKPPDRGAIAGVGLATVGLALLSLESDLSIHLGDILVFCCAIGFAAHILLVGRFAPAWQPLQLAFVQIVTVAILSLGLAGLAEQPIGWPTANVWFAAAFTGLLATSLAFFLQSRAQRDTTPTHTALIFSAEPVFAGIFSLLLIGEVLGMRQIAGCALILAGMLAAEYRGRSE